MGIEVRKNNYHVDGGYKHEMQNEEVVGNSKPY